MAGLELLVEAKAEIVGASFLVNLPDLGGVAQLKAQNVQVETLLSYEGH